jgi:hypothetical protein
MEARELLSILQIGDPRALIVITGGAGGMSADEISRARPLFLEGLARVAAAESIAILDGGTNSGVMALAGEGAQQHGLSAPLIGVCPRACVGWPGHWNPWARAQLEPNHSHFALTPGRRFGDESALIYEMAQALGERMPTLALLVNGGEIALDEALRNATQGREMIVLEGSGRAADAIAAAYRSRRAEDARLATIIKRGRIVLFPVAEGPDRLAQLLRERLWR